MKKFIVIILFLIIALLFLFKGTVNLDTISCEAKFNSVSKDRISNLYLSYTFHNGTGWVNMKGTTKSNGVEQDINRKMFFDFVRVKNNFKLTSKQVLHLYNDNYVDDESQTILPKPYFEDNLEMDIFIYPHLDRGYLFSTNETPSFYCR